MHTPLTEDNLLRVVYNLTGGRAEMVEFQTLAKFFHVPENQVTAAATCVRSRGFGLVTFGGVELNEAGLSHVFANLAPDGRPK